MKKTTGDRALPLLGAIAGDIIGSHYERERIKTKEFPIDGGHFTDDTVMTVAVADALLNGRDYATAMLRWGRKYPLAGFGTLFKRWLMSGQPVPYGSCGNGSAMRVAAIGCAFDKLTETLSEAELSAVPTHDHPEGIKGAKAAAAALFLARNGASKERIRSFITDRFGYGLKRSVDTVRKSAKLDQTCRGTVPFAIISFLESTDYEDAVRNAVSLGGDSDTLACITGGIAAAFYGEIPEYILEFTYDAMKLEMHDVLARFSAAVNGRKPRAER